MTDAVPMLLGFARAVRAAGVPVTHDRAQGFVQAAALAGATDRAALRRAGRATLCGSPDDLIRHDQVFEAWFDARDGLPRTVDRTAEQAAPSTLPETDRSSSGGEEEADLIRAMASDADVLRHRDVASLTNAEKARLAALLARLRPTTPLRRAHRQTPWRRGRLDARRTLRQVLRHHGEPSRLQWRDRRDRPRRVVLLVDVSGSMSSYADVLLRVAHRFAQAGPRTEVFTVGTRLTRITRALAQRDPERALIAAGDTVPDWSGGTRLGETLKVFLDRWGQRGLARGAVVVVFSDGWERGDCGQLAEQAARLSRLAHRVVWVNPHRGKSGYEPIQSGILAVLPHVDDFVAGHSLATYQRLCEVVADA